MKKQFFITLILGIRLMLAHGADYAKLQTLVRFTGTNGLIPTSGLVLGKDGNFYGTTYGGGAYMKDSPNGYGYGTAYKMTPEGKLTTLVSFTTGTAPSGNLVQGKDGNFYGETLMGGKLGDGTVFRMTPEGSVTTLFSFGAYDKYGGISTNGHNPVGGLSLGADGNFYGITSGYQFQEAWTLFRISREGDLSTLFVLPGLNSARPASPSRLAIAGDGNPYGFIGQDIFRVTRGGTLETVVSLTNSAVSQPCLDLVAGNGGKLYGMTASGGTNGAGVLFAITVAGKVSVLASFSATNKVEGRPTSLIQGADGNFYGTAMNGGKYELGTLFRVNRKGLVTILAEFNRDNGFNPVEQLVQGKNGTLYGTTPGGMGTGGTIFRLSISGKNK